MRRGVRLELLSSTASRDRLRAGELCNVQKFATVDAPDAAETRDVGELTKVSFVISDESKDRYGDVISADGWDFKNFNANPVLLWAHDYSLPPVGRLGQPWKSTGKKVKAIVERFATEEENPMGPAVEKMLRGGLLNAVSVGFSPIEFTFNDDYSINYIKQELLEVSVVPVPANANALVAAKSAGLWVPQMNEWVVKQLDTKVGGLAGEFAQTAFLALRSPQVQVPTFKARDVIVEADAPAGFKVAAARFAATTDSSDEAPLPEIVALGAALEENTATMRELVAELRAERLDRQKAAAVERTERIAARARAELGLSPTPQRF